MMPTPANPSLPNPLLALEALQQVLEQSEARLQRGEALDLLQIQPPLASQLDHLCQAVAAAEGGLRLALIAKLEPLIARLNQLEARLRQHANAQNRLLASQAYANADTKKER